MVSEKEIIIPVDGAEQLTDHHTTPSNTTNDRSKQSDMNATENDDLRNQLLRLQAEFVNYKNRVAKERESDFLNAKGFLITKLLPVLDDLERMIDHHQEDGVCDVEGIHIIFQNLKKILKDEKLIEIQAVGQPFDPEIHEAVGVEEVNEDRDGIVMEVWQKGYQFGEKLLRPSRVKVGQCKKIEKAQ